MCAYLMESVSVRVHAFVLWTTSAQVFEFVQTILVCNVYLLACACIPELQYCVCVCVCDRVCLPVQVNFLEGVVSSSLSAMSPGPAQRAMPGSL